MLIETWRNLASLLFKYAQMNAPFTILIFSFYRGDDYMEFPYGYSRHTVTGFIHIVIVDYIILLT